MASGRYNTMEEGLTKIAQDLTLLLATPDADDAFISELMVQVMGKLKQYGNPSGPGGDTSGPNPMGRQAPPPPPELMAALGGPVAPQAQGGPPPMPMPPGGGMAGGPPLPPNPDELRRLQQ